MKTLRLVLGDQLNAAHPWFETVSGDVVYMMAEMRQETDYAPHHIQKVLAFFAAMRAFAQARRAEGHRVVYLELDEGRKTQGLEANVRMVMAEEDLASSTMPTGSITTRSFPLRKQRAESNGAHKKKAW